ncbi:4Fe-4S dicluster domain-containing protein [Deferribacter autotrophicus]|uniref:4Fe-4S dicluster domain-containing protein n=1 Tax=Deferribacter autotrophicus TaxID=500465 RepID=A0A5A8F446_9BACT|nr:4Fe-4S dicluster domain-containing protein [Deferribacter autotrophicus]KAA0257813.1 4Fe-4S dicluster domain-containing protein [Deferribacter autotrophicus]
MKIDDLKNFLNRNPFKGFFKKNRMRPPGAQEESKFMELCIRCARCIEVCPYDSIKRADVFERLQIGTPYIFAEEKGCYLCMKCPTVCPTGALDNNITKPEQVEIGIAIINQETCLNFKYFIDEEKGVSEDALLCSICYDVCPLRDTAIVMEHFILPVITDSCTGCGVCTEKCPTTPKSVNIIPKGMEEKELAGFYYRKLKIQAQKRSKTIKDTMAEKTEIEVKKKESISSFGEKPTFESNFDVQETIDEWEEQE